MLVDTKIDELPPNVLLMRILEGKLVGCCVCSYGLGRGRLVDGILLWNFDGKKCIFVTYASGDLFALF